MTHNYSFDEIRKDPSVRLREDDLIASGIVGSRHALRAAIRSGKLPKPIGLGRSKYWEGRTILQAVGAPTTVVED